MANSRVLRTILWVVLVASPIISILIIGLATNSSIFSLDAWNTTWNDELFYNRVIRQMREVGTPTGMAGYNEVPATNPSYGTYSMFIYIPYYLGSLVTGYASHNFMYMVNMGFGVLSCLIVIVVLRPNVRETLLSIGFVVLYFIIARFLCSGMTEGSYVLFAAIFIACSIYAAKNAEDPGKKRLVVAALIVMIASVGFWGLMRPYILAFMFVVWVMVARVEFGLQKRQRVALFCSAVVVCILAIVIYFYLSRYYATPYFGNSTLGNAFFERLAAGLNDFASKHVRCVLYSAARLYHLAWQGVILFTFAAGWFILLVMFLKSRKKGDRARSSLFLSLLIAGFAIFEAHMCIYAYQQMHRTMLPLVVSYVVVIIWYGSECLKNGKPVVQIAFVTVLAALSIGSMALWPGDFVLPQTRADRTPETEAALQAQLEEIMPRAEERWDNTLAHIVEYNNIYLYFNVPLYINTNTLKGDYLQEAVEAGTLKSKYLCIYDGSKRTAIVQSHYELVFEGYDHTIYKVRD